jgi:hypothetical protein
MKFGLEELRKLRKGVEFIGKDFKPDEDWSAMAWLYSPEKGLSVISLGMLFQDENGKMQVVPALSEIAQETKAVSGAFLTSQWMVHLRSDDPLTETSLEMIRRFGTEGRTDRVEQVALEICDGKKTEVWEAKINRTPDKPPTLGPWELFPEFSEGTLANVIQRVLNTVKK